MRSVGIFGLVLGMAVFAGEAALADAPKVRSRNSLSGVREVNHFATQAQFARMMSLGCKVDVSGGPGPVIYNTDGCDMLDYPVGDPITYASFVAQRLARDVPGSAVPAGGEFRDFVLRVRH